MRISPSAKLDKALIASYRKTHSVFVTAKEIGCSATTVHRWLTRQGVVLDGLERYRKRIKRTAPHQDQAILASYKAGASLSALSERYGVSVWLIRDRLKKAGVERRRRGQVATVETKALMTEIATLYRKLGSQQAVGKVLGKSQIVISRLLRKQGLHRGDKARGARHGSWKGGRSLQGNGYVLVMPNMAGDEQLASMQNRSGYFLEHRLVMARSLGRPLSPNETVHHINGDKTDNRLSNLQLRNGKHGTGAAFVCSDCGSHNIVATKLL